MKDLYVILCVARGAEREEIDAAYARRVEETIAAAAPDCEARLAELKEAHAVLSDPGARDIYNQSLRFAVVQAAMPAPRDTGLPAREMAPEPVIEERRSFPFVWVALAVILAAGSLVWYGNRAKQQERLRIQQEQEIQLRAQKADEERLRLEQEQREAAAEERQRRALEAQERDNRISSEHALRESDRRYDTEQREAEWARRREAAQTAEKERQAEYQKQREQEQVNRQLERYRRELQRPPRY